MIKTIDPALGETVYTYDADGNLTQVTDANGNPAFRYAYDTRGLKTTETSPSGQVTSFAYDANGNLVTKTDAKGQVVTYIYDKANRMISASYPAAGLTPAKTVTYTYDANGNLTGYSDGITTGAYTYDNLNRKISESVNYGSFTLSSSYTYYANGQKKTYTGADGVTISYSYDAANQLQTVSIPTEGAIVYNGYQWTSPSQITLPGGSSKNYTYDGLLRPTTIHMKDPANNTLMRYAYTYDAAGNITVKDTEHGNYAYGYDNLDRLTSANYPTYNELFAYDKVGNRTNHNNSAPWTYNTNNELTARPVITYAYDANGSQTQKTEGGIITDYVYDSSNRLIQVKQGATEIANYKHDPFGRRISKTVSGTTTYFYYTDEGLTAEASSTGTVSQSYGYAPNSTWGTNPLYTKANGTYHYYLNDHLGTPQQLAQKNGAKSWAAIYEAFGKATVTNSTVTNNLRFPGQYADAETGYHYNFHRTYDNQIGRYIKADPIGLRGGGNIFLYAEDNPVTKFDNFGLDTAVIMNGYTSTIMGLELNNPFGHLALAFTGKGVFSFGNKYPLGGSLTKYMMREAPKRDSQVLVIKTTLKQEEAMAEYLYGREGTPLEKWPDNCASRSAQALKKAGISVVDTGLPEDIRKQILLWMLVKGGEIYDVPMGTVSISSGLNQFNP